MTDFPELPDWLNRSLSETEREIAWIDWPVSPVIRTPRVEDNWYTIARTPTEADLRVREELLGLESAKAYAKRSADAIRFEKMRAAEAEAKAEEGRIKEAAAAAQLSFNKKLRGSSRAR